MVDFSASQLSVGGFSAFCTSTKDQIKQDKFSQWQPGQRETLYEALNARNESFAGEATDINATLLDADAKSQAIWKDPMLSNEGKGQKCSAIFQEVLAGFARKEAAIDVRFNERQRNIENAMQLKRPTTGDKTADEILRSQIREYLKSSSDGKLQFHQYYQEMCKTNGDAWWVDTAENPPCAKMAVLTQDEIEQGQQIRKQVAFPVEWWHRVILEKERQEFQMLLWRARKAVYELGYVGYEGGDAELIRVAQDAVNKRRNSR